MSKKKRLPIPKVKDITISKGEERTVFTAIRDLLNENPNTQFFISEGIKEVLWYHEKVSHPNYQSEDDEDWYETTLNGEEYRLCMKYHGGDWSIATRFCSKYNDQYYHWKLDLKLMVFFHFENENVSDDC